MITSELSEPTALTPAERNYVRPLLSIYFSTLPIVAEDLALKTWASGPHRGQPKMPKMPEGLVARGLMRLDVTGRQPRLLLTVPGMAALQAMMADARLADPARFAHVRRELGIGSGEDQAQSIARHVRGVRQS